MFPGTEAIGGGIQMLAFDCASHVAAPDVGPPHSFLLWFSG